MVISQMSRQLQQGTMILVSVILQLSIWIDLPSAHAGGGASISSVSVLHQPTKVTVGPFDNHQGDVSRDGQWLAFTRTVDLAPHIFLQDLTTGREKALFDLSVDGNQPRFGQDGSRLLFVSFERSSRGELCWITLAKVEETHCIPEHGKTILSPFWVDSQTVGYLARDPFGEDSELVFFSLDRPERRVIRRGKIWAPSMAEGGRYIVAFEDQTIHGELRRTMFLLDRHSLKQKELPWDLPGISGFAAIDDHEEYLYFSHYFNDTNRDRLIDGHDHSVLFRSKLSDLWTDQLRMPEQLTSAELDCNFPSPKGAYLYTSCAFEGSLDIYRLPREGMIPKEWGLEKLRRGYETLRSYQDRVLMSNVLRHRHCDQSGFKTFVDLLSNHLFSQEYFASVYYVQRILNHLSDSQNGGQDHEFWLLFLTYLHSEEIRHERDQGHLSFKSARHISGLLRRTENLKLRSQQNSGMKSLVLGHLYEVMERPQSAHRIWVQTRVEVMSSPIEHHLHFELAHKLFLSKKLDRKSLWSTYLQMANSSVLSHETRIYYAFRLLEEMEAMLSRRKDRVQQIELFLSEKVKTQKKMDSGTRALLEAELWVLKLMGASDSEKGANYSEHVKMVNVHRGDYFLSKAIYIRAITQFIKSDNYKYAQFVTTNWLRFAEPEDSEYIYAREQYRSSEIERGYWTLGEGRYQTSSGHFYGALSLTDDLESHYSFLVSKQLEGKLAQVGSLYENLKKRGVIGESLAFAESVIELLSLEEKGKSRDPSTMDGILKRVESIQGAQTSSTWHLLLGYLYLEKFFLQDKEVLDLSHRHLMLALDLGRNNVRVKATALMNLALLHQRAGNHSMANRFFSQRRELGFDHFEEFQRFSWFFARSLYYADLSKEALKVLSESVPDPSSSFHRAWLEKQGFYATVAQDFEEAHRIYVTLRKYENLLDEWTRIKVLYNHGYALFKLKRGEQASSIFKEVLRQLESRSDGKSDRLKLHLLGFLSQLEGAELAIKFKEERESLFVKVGSDLDRVSMKREWWFESRIKNQIQLAKLYLGKSDLAKSKESLSASLLLATEMAEESGEHLSRPIFEALSGYYLALVEERADAPSSQASELLSKTLREYERLGEGDATVAYRWLSLQVLKKANEIKSPSGRSMSGSSPFGELLASSNMKFLEATDPALAEKIRSRCLHLVH